MAAQLVKYFDDTFKEFGVPGRMKLAMITCFTSETAKASPDSEENIAKFKEAIEQIRKQAAK